MRQVGPTLTSLPKPLLWGYSFMGAQAPTTCFSVALSVAVGMLLASCGGGVGTPMEASAPVITTQPANQTVGAGQTATFSVVATGTPPLSYQWQKGTSAIAGATSTTYTTPPTGLSDSGSTFRVVVSNSAGTATSDTATLTVNSVSATTAISGRRALAPSREQHRPLIPRRRRASRIAG